MKHFLSTLLLLLSINTFAHECKQFVIINTVPAGGLMDSTARDIAATVKEITGIPAVVESRPAGEGLAALNYLRTLPADGCTVGYFRSSMYQRQAMEGVDAVGYDIMKEFVHAGIGLKFPFLIAGSAKVTPNTWTEFVAYIKANKTSISSAGAPNDIIIDAFEELYRPDWTRPMFKGGNPQLLELLGGHHDFYVGITIPALTYAAEGKLKPYAVTSERRLRAYPNIPTLRELGVNRIDYGWASVSMLANTPTETVKLWSQIITATWSKKELHAKYDTAAGIVGEDTDTVSATRYLNREMTKLRKTK